MILKSKREKTLLAATAVVCAVALGYLGFDRYQAAKGTLENDWENVETAYDRKLEKIRRMVPADIRNRHNRITEKLRIPGSYLDVQLTVREELDEYLTNSGVTDKWETIPKEVLEMPEFGIQKYQYAVQNLYITIPVLARFLYFLSRESSLMEVEELQIRPDVRRGGSNRFRVTMTVSRIVFTEKIREDLRKKEKDRGRKT